MIRIKAVLPRELRPASIFLNNYSYCCSTSQPRLQRRAVWAADVTSEHRHHRQVRCFGSKPSPRRRKSIHVLEQTISSSIANHTASYDEEDKGSVKVRGHIVYQPTDKDVGGWQVVKNPRKDSNESTPSSSFSMPTLLHVKDFTNIRNIPFIHHFLPANFPHSVDKSYATYASYCFLGSVAGSSAMVLSTQALLVAVGVGTQSAAPMAAALNWVMKDGVGQLGGVLFASQLGKGGMDVDYWKNKAGEWLGPLTSKKGTKKRGNFQRGTADTNPKRWRMVAALALDLSTLLEICTPFLGAEYFLPCASIANVGKNIGFLAASASRAAIHQSLTKTEGKTSNLGDVTAKAGSQAILASLLGTGFGILFSQTFCSDYGTAGILAGFVVLSAVHQVCTYKAIQAVPLKTLDRHRLHIVLDSYMQANFDQIIRQSGTHKHDSLKAPLTPTEVAERESFLPLMPPDQSVRWLSVGASLVDICPSGVDELESLMIQEEREAEVNGVDHYEKYILKVLTSSTTGSDDGAIQLTFFEGASDDDLLKGMFHAYAAHECMRNEVFREDDTTTIAKHSYDITKSQMPQFMNHLEERGWQMETGFVNVECGSSCRLKIQEV
eukprot:scaffold6337_cov126-Skeletonema_marinoi.AAC.1